MINLMSIEFAFKTEHVVHMKILFIATFLKVFIFFCEK